MLVSYPSWSLAEFYPSDWHRTPPILNPNTFNTAAPCSGTVQNPPIWKAWPKSNDGSSGYLLHKMWSMAQRKPSKADCTLPLLRKLKHKIWQIIAVVTRLSRSVFVGSTSTSPTIVLLPDTPPGLLNPAQLIDISISSWHTNVSQDTTLIIEAPPWWP